VIITLFIATISFATNAPKAVKAAFAKKFPTTISVKWHKENSKEYEGYFTLNGTKMSANFTNDGVWLATETEIKISEFPSAVLATIKSKYTDWTITTASKIETLKEVQYEADIVKGKEKKEILLKEDGSFIK